jgi:shikimate kinase
MSQVPNVQTLAGTDDPRSEPEQPVHIVLLGLMGTGKSTVGRLVATELGRPFVDSDSLVELRTGHLPPELVDRAGVDELHAVELAALRHVVAQRDPVVYAAAASVVDVVTPDDLAAAWCVWLDTAPSVLADRVSGDRHERPLLGDQPESVLAAQHERRAQRGRDLAAESVTTDGLTAAEVASLVCDTWREWSRSRRP